jgi:hypothetical protein
VTDVTGLANGTDTCGSTLPKKAISGLKFLVMPMTGVTPAAMVTVSVAAFEHG